MTWEELVRLCKLFTKGYNANAFTDYGYYTPWWFAFGWSVGGNVIQHIDDDDPAYNDGYYAFTLGDEKANYIVKDGVDALTLTNGRVYRAGELIEYADRDALTAGEKASLTALPSMREAFDFFITLSTGNNPKYGIGKPIAAKPSDVTSGEYALFSDEKVAMYTDGRFAVPTFRRDCDFKWDAAPLPKFASGIKAGHSTSMCYSIARTSKNLDAAFELIEYLAGPNGQAELIDSGFNVPTYKSVTATQRFMKPPSGVYPQNSFAFSDAAAYQTQGDWGFLPDDAWIREWAPTVNGDLRNGKKANGTAYTVNDFFADSKLFVNTDDVLKAYTRK
jgi:maltose-binding protein MalE